MTDATSAKTARRSHHWRRDVTELAALFAAVAVADALANLIGHQPDGPYLLIASAVTLAVTATVHTWWARRHSHAPPPTGTDLITETGSTDSTAPYDHTNSNTANNTHSGHDSHTTALATTTTATGPGPSREDTVLWRMRTTVRDVPGSLAALCSTLAQHRVDILALQTHPLTQGTADELLLRAPAPLQTQQLSRAISAAGAARPGSSGRTRTIWWTPRHASWVSPRVRPWMRPNSPFPTSVARSLHDPLAARRIDHRPRNG